MLQQTCWDCLQLQKAVFTQFKLHFLLISSFSLSGAGKVRKEIGVRADSPEQNFCLCLLNFELEMQSGRVCYSSAGLQGEKTSEYRTMISEGLN